MYGLAAPRVVELGNAARGDHGRVPLGHRNRRAYPEPASSTWRQGTSAVRHLSKGAARLSSIDRGPTNRGKPAVGVAAHPWTPATQHRVTNVQPASPKHQQVHPPPPTAHSPSAPSRGHVASAPVAQAVAQATTLRRPSGHSSSLRAPCWVPRPVSPATKAPSAVPSKAGDCRVALSSRGPRIQVHALQFRGALPSQRRSGVYSAMQSAMQNYAQLGSPVMAAHMSKVAAPPRASPSLVLPAQREDRGGPLLEESNVLLSAKPVLKVVSPAMADVMQEPVGTADAVAENAVAEFLCREAVPEQELASSTLIDVPQYFEKRRVQNSLRRLLEAVHEHVFGLHANVQAIDLGVAFDRMAEYAGCRASPEGLSLTEQQFSNFLEAYGIWPPEFLHKDRSEVFTALLVPTTAVARAVLSGGHLRTVLTRQALCEGFDQVPFNLADYPVPAHLLRGEPTKGFTTEQSEAVAEAVAATFATQKTGLDRVKDFFLTGLVSVEEIQMALPNLFPVRLVEDAAAHIIQAAAPLFTPEEWQDLVISVRTLSATALEEGGEPCQLGPEACAADELVPQAATFSVSLASPQPQHRDLSATGCLSERSGATEAEVGMRRCREGLEAGAVTEPLPCRELRSEDPVRFMISEAEQRGNHASELRVQAPAAPEPPRVIDWSTVRQDAGASACGIIRGHQADEGAGGRSTWGTSAFKKELAASSAKWAGDKVLPGGMDCLALVSLDLLPESGGPYLARAFVRCCQLYTRRRLTHSGAGEVARSCRQ